MRSRCRRPGQHQRQHWRGRGDRGDAGRAEDQRHGDPDPEQRGEQRHAGRPQRAERDHQDHQRNQHADALGEAEAGRLSLYASPPTEAFPPAISPWSSTVCSARASNVASAMLPDSTSNRSVMIAARLSRRSPPGRTRRTGRPRRRSGRSPRSPPRPARWWPGPRRPGRSRPREPRPPPGPWCRRPAERSGRGSPARPGTPCPAGRTTRRTRPRRPRPDRPAPRVP